MLCLVTQPNGFLLEIYLSPKARGQECLDKVCEELSIIEVDFFGLQYENKNGDLYWLNLRNSIRQQSNQSEIIRLNLKVKFYVPPYLIQQDSTRHQFYLNIKKSLKQRQLKVSDNTKLAKLIALIAQAEVGNFRDDSFDLKQLYSEWILVLKDGRFDPHQSVIETTHKRRKYNSESNSIEDISEELHQSSNEDSICSSNSLISLADSRFCKIERLSNEHSQFYFSVVEFHQQLNGYLPSKAESSFLEEVSELEDIGIDYFTAKVENSPYEKCKIGVGTRGVTIKMTDKKLINYASLVKVRTSTHFFTLKYINDNGEVKEKKFRLASTKSANALYRVVTEKHVFYSCDTVGDSVATQCILGISGMFWSITPAIFKDGSESGKNFVFDIRRTLRQFYDDVQRTMFKLRTHLSNNLTLDQLELPSCDSPCENSLEVTDQQTTIAEKLLCRICYDRQVSAAFIPCGHVMSCEKCSIGCDLCPVCRAHIESRLKIFF